MSVHHPTRQQGIEDLLTTVKEVVKQTMQHAAIGRAGLRVYDAGEITIVDGGGIDIQGGGFIRIDGTIDGDGTFVWDGTFTVRGPWEMEGLGEITGNTSLAGNLSVANDGKIIVGDMVIDPSAGAGRVTFANGATIQAEESGVSIKHGTARVNLNNNRVNIAYGFNQLNLRDEGAFIVTGATFSDPTLPAGVLRATGSGRIEKNAP